MDQLGEKETFLYDEEGNLTLHVDRDGNRIQRSYNVFGDVVYEKATDDLGEHPCISTYGYDSLGRLVRAVCEGHSYEYVYDECGFLKEKRSSGKRLVSYVYNSGGQIIEMTDPVGVTTWYTYDCLGRRSWIKSDLGVEVKYGYDCLNRVVESVYGNGVVTHYEYDGNGNRIGKAGEQKLGEQYNVVNTMYRYDVRGRLLEENRDGNLIAYMYDASGNRIQEESRGGITCYAYNEKNQQIQVKREESQIQTSRYDAEGLRFEMKENERLIRFAYHNGELLYERSEEEQTSYLLGRGIEARQTSQGISYYHQDEQLSTVCMTDGAGEIQNYYQYDAYGVNELKMTRNEGPALLMTKEDHALTRTYRGRGKQTMINDKGLGTRQRMVLDIINIRENFGTKYNKGLLESIKYTKTLPQFLK